MVGQTTATVGVSDKTLLIYAGHGSFDSYDNFDAAYNDSNTVLRETTWPSLDGADLLFLAQNREINEESILADIDAWFGNGKVLWVASDSDFSGDCLSSCLNDVLETVGSQLRLDASAVYDPVHNDGASYRVMSYEAGDGPIATQVLTGVANISMPFHGPTSVYASVSGTATDLRTTVPEGVEVILYSADTSLIDDQDASLSAEDFYSGESTTGSYPLLAVEEMSNGGIIIASGEAILSDYKNMYGDVWEQSALPHEGKEISDNLLTWALPASSSGDDSPLDMSFFLLSLGLIAIFTTLKRRRN
jgi:hypothetical protein